MTPRRALTAAILASAALFAAACGPEPASHGSSAPTPAPAVSVAAGAEGLLRLARRDGRLGLDLSTDAGLSFHPMAFVTGGDEEVNYGHETRPQVNVDSAGRVHVTYERRRGGPYSGDIVLRTSVDGGRTFGAPRVVNDDLAEVGHSFHAARIDPSGDLVIAWLDDRGGNHLRDGADRPEARGLYVARLAGGRPDALLANRVVRHNRVCDCCRPAMAFTDDGAPVILARLAVDGRRDHGLFFLGPDREPRAIDGPRDDWRIDGCPHHGPAIAGGAGRRLHLAWFTGGEVRQGLFYAWTDDGGLTYSTPRSLGRPPAVAGHPALHARRQDVWLAWEERLGSERRVIVEHSADNGATWSAPVQAAQAPGPADYPTFVDDGRRVWVSWASSGAAHVLAEVTRP